MVLAAQNAVVGARVPRDRAKETWPMVRLGDVCESFNGMWKGTKPPLKNVGVLRATNITKQCEFDSSRTVFIDVEETKFSKRKLQYGDIVVERSGGGPGQPVGRVIFFNLHDGDYTISNFTSALRVKDTTSLDPYYLYRVLVAKYFSGVTESMQSNSIHIINLNYDAYLNIQIPLPPLHVQREIVARLEKELGEADRGAAKFKAIAEDADAEFKAELDETFKALEEGENSEAGVCRSSSIGSFEAFCNMMRGEYITRKDAKPGCIPVILGGREPAYHIDKSNHVGECLVISRSGASAGFVSYWNEPIFVTDGFIIEVKDNADIRFAYYYYQSLYEKLAISKNGSAIPHVTGSGIQALGFPSLPLSIQHAIVARLDGAKQRCEKLKAAAERGLREAENLRKAILAEAFS